MPAKLAFTSPVDAVLFTPVAFLPVITIGRPNIAESLLT